jgi:ABC-type tungstate transport system permease subunit
LPRDGQLSIQELFSQIFIAAVSSQHSSSPVRFLSRYDKSANNIRESAIWASIGQTPWSEPYSPWYHRYVDFPLGALRAAAKLGEYTLVDRGSWYAAERQCKNGLIVYKEVFGASEDDNLLNPAHVLVGTKARDMEIAIAFVDWLTDKDHGQRVIGKQAVDGVVLHSPAPENPVQNRAVNTLHQG